MITQVITYEIDVAYEYDSDIIPNLSMLTSRTLKNLLHEAIERMRQDNALGIVDIEPKWVEVK